MTCTNIFTYFAGMFNRIIKLFSVFLNDMLSNFRRLVCDTKNKLLFENNKISYDINAIIDNIVILILKNSSGNGMKC